MAFTLEAFCELRPYVYHLTAATNLPHLLALRRLYSARHLLHASNNRSWLAEKRPTAVGASMDQQRISVRDQAPLHQGNIAFAEGWTFGDVLADLNARVFFWPGNGSKPIDYGERHFQRYAAEKPKMIRLETAALFRLNAAATPQFCKFNSGSPRYNKGKASPRGPETFVAANAAPFRPSEVVELTFRDEVALPVRFETSDSPFGPWQWM